MNGKVVIGTELDTSDIDRQIDLLTSRLETLEFEYDVIKKSKPFDGQADELRKISTEIISTKRKITSLRVEKDKLGQSGFQNILSSVNNIGKSVEGVTKKVGRWALAIFGVRSAYMAIRSAMNIISSQDEQLKADIEYMKSALAYTLEPVVRGIVDLMKQLMFYVAYIVKAWTGRNIFANANKGLKSATSSAKALNKELNKTLSNFDEMNVLQDSSSASGGTSGTGTVLPSFDLTQPENIEPPAWLKWIVEHKDEILAILTGIATALLLIRFGINAISALGIGLAITGLIYTIEKIRDFLKDPTFKNFIGILEGIAVTVAGVALAFHLWPIAIGAALAFGTIEIVKHFDTIKTLINEAIKWMDVHVLGALRMLFGPLGDILYLPIKFFVEMARSAFNSFYGGLKEIVNGIIKIFKGDFFGGIKTIFGGLQSILTTPFNAFLSAVLTIINRVYGLFKELGTKAGDVIGGAFKAVINTILSYIETQLNKPIDAINGLIGIISKVGINVGKISRIKLPKLARGGIVNNPGPGVMMGNYIAGEKGPEAIIPLDDNTLDRLGLAFARHTVINANITNTMNGRVISRELQRVQNNSDFAYNR